MKPKKPKKKLKKEVRVETFILICDCGTRFNVSKWRHKGPQWQVVSSRDIKGVKITYKP